MRQHDAPTPTPARTLMNDRLGWLGLRSGQILLVITLTAAVIFGLVQIKLVVIPVLIAVILASALTPVVAWLRRRGIPSALATWITLLASIAALGGIITLIVFAVRDQWDKLFTSAAEGLDTLQVFLLQGPIHIDEQQIEDLRATAVDFVTSSQFGTGALAGASVVAELLTGIVLLLVILFFFLKDGDRIWNFFLAPFQGTRLERGRRIGVTARGVLGGYVRGTAIVALVDASAIGIGLAILQVPLALPLAVIVFLGAFIPLIGATAAGVLAALVALVANGPLIALIVIIIVIGVNQLEGNLLQPVVMAQNLKLHPLVILFALTAGTILAGIVGAVLSVPIAAVAWAIVKTWNEPASSRVVPPQNSPSVRRRRRR
ncbi:AI-2E family transporter [Cryobacterium psychrophilum]|uniref:AI-2E family transporter n=1 Tax=Cryobacterium psychrophilum TaxID=41988 RepID=A0A4Y8KNF6_9MICO|nr:AI-2E family transporter [Cryobacterium psychrophilum]TDW29073.1 putative PurR-regulated permease PerM [Cryobacterium psychrophilum]TFD79715.1 AI-2E family transporter [Cryobacterium psychrophilum]